MNIKVTCLHCGSSDIREFWHVLTTAQVRDWAIAEDGLPTAMEYSGTRGLEDVPCSDDSQFICSNCDESLAVHDLKVETADGTGQ
jgi:hypothetical protein